jgi:hypothetical protein
MLRGDDPQALLNWAEEYWPVIRDALLNPEDWDDQEWRGCGTPGSSASSGF